MIKTLKETFVESLLGRKVRFPQFNNEVYIVKDISFGCVNYQREGKEPLTITAQFTCTRSFDPTPLIVLVSLDDGVEFID